MKKSFSFKRLAILPAIALLRDSALITLPKIQAEGVNTPPALSVLFSLGWLVGLVSLCDWPCFYVSVFLTLRAVAVDQAILCQEVRQMIGSFFGGKQDFFIQIPGGAIA